MYTLGQKLDKKQRMTDWGQRPLSEGQIAYAAADATVVLDIFHQLEKDITSRDGCFDISRFQSELQAVAHKPPPQVADVPFVDKAQQPAELGGWVNAWGTGE